MPLFNRLTVIMLSAVIALFAGTCFAKGPARRGSVVSLDPKTTVPILGGIDSGTAAQALKTMAEVEAAGSKEITFVLDSPGGYVDPGLRLVVAMQSFIARGGTVRCLVTGEAMSMAYYLLGACNERYVMARSQLLWHPIRIGIQGGLTGEAALAIGQSLLAFEQSMKEELIGRMQVDPTWFDMHWRAETSHHGSDLAFYAPTFITVIQGFTGLPMQQAYWIREPSPFDSTEPLDAENGLKYWGPSPRSN